MAPISGIRVVECGVAVAGPLTARYLGHLGADVIKVEAPAGPSPQGSAGPNWAPPGLGAVGADLLAGNNLFNSQKRSLALDLRSPDGQAIFRDLIAVSDVFVCNMSLPAIQNLHLDYESLSQVNPRLIHLAMPGFGTTGPYSSYRSWGPNLSSLTGFDNLTGEPGRPPVMTPVPLPDYVCGYHAVSAVLAALRQRDQCGRGQRIDLAQFNATTALLGPQLAHASIGTVLDRNGNRQEGVPLSGVFPSFGNDRWVAISARSSDEWAALCQVAGHPDWRPRWTGSPSPDLQDTLEELVASWTRTVTPYEAAGRLQAVGVTAAPVADQWDQVADQQLIARRYWKLVTHARLGIDLIPGLPFDLPATPLNFDSAASPIGWNTDEVVGDLLGRPKDAVAALKEKGVIAGPNETEVDPTAGNPGRPWFRWGLPLLRLPGPTEPSAIEGSPSRASDGTGQPRLPLAGIRVLDLSDEMSAYGTRLLQLLGAAVTRVELPGETLSEAAPVERGLSLYREYMDAGKERVALDIETADGAGEFRRLLSQADVLYDSCPTGYLESRGLAGVDQPGLIRVAVTAFGDLGPCRDWKADELILWALSGMLQYTGYPDSIPVMPGGKLSYSLVGLHGAMATLGALAGRDATGLGQSVSVSAHEALVATAQGGAGMISMLDDMVPRRRTGDRSLASMPYGFYACADRLVSILALFPDHWDSLSKWIHEVTGNQAVLDEKFRGPGTARNAFAAELTGYLTDLTSRFPAQQFCAEAQARGIPAAPVNSLADTLRDPHLAAIGYWDDQEHPVLGALRWPGPPFRLQLDSEAVLGEAAAAAVG